MPQANVSRYVDPRNHCPLGCSAGQLDSYGYCCHLVGFTNKGQVMECVRYDDRGFPVVGRNEDGTPLRQPIAKGDKLVNPLKQMKDEAGLHMVPEWVSSRVYRRCGEEEAKAWRESRVAPVDEETMALADPV